MPQGDPISYLTLETGVEVFSTDGERIGVVDRVLGDDDTGIFDGLVIDIRTGPGGHRFVDAPEVAEIRERAVVLSLSASEVERLGEPEPGPAVIEHHGAEDAESMPRSRLRRIWDLLSGRR